MDKKHLIKWYQVLGKMLVLIPRLPSILLYIYRALRIKNNSRLSLGLVLEKNAEVYGNARALLFDERVISHSELNAITNQYYHYFKSFGVVKGEVIAVFIDNGPEILFVVGGLSKLGAVASLINPNHRHESLCHSIATDVGNHILVSESLYPHLLQILEFDQSAKPKIHWMHNNAKSLCPKDCFDFNKLLIEKLDTNPSETGKIRAEDRFANVFTSGTTGMPKAAIQTHRRWLQLYYWFGKVNLNLNRKDILYVPIPFYHSNALMVAWASTAANGAALAIRQKFSTSNFWLDVKKFKATSFIYIGEICRYLNNMPKTEEERHNTISKIVGNGLRPEIWKQFKKRFGISTILEFYGSADGNIAFTNTLNLNHTVGWTPAKYSLVRYDLEHERPQYNTSGYCIKCKIGEQGLLISKIDKKTPLAGYVNKAENQSKILRNVFKDGDVWFNSGDLLKSLGYGHLEFVDRIGDTFRWKGENVATTEIEKIANAYPGVILSAAYGVKIPFTDGKAGMLALNTFMKWNPEALGKFHGYLEKRLPSYAVPLFLRFCQKFETTPTLKVKKVGLKKEGFDLDMVPDSIFVLLPKGKGYVQFDNDIWEEINQGKHRF